MADGSSLTTQPGPTDLTLRVLTFNTFMGRRLDEVSRIIRDVRPHLAFLQELIIYRYRGWTWNQAEGLGRELEMDHAFQSIKWRGGTDIGAAILTTGRLRDAAPIEGLPDRPTGVSARVAFGSHTISVACVHLSSVGRPLVLGYPLAIRRHCRQVGWAIGRLEQLGGPTILAGDLNTIPGTPAHRLACRHLNDVARQASDRTGTRPTLGWPFRIDYIFASSHFTCEQYRVLSAEGSDHRPVTATLRLGAGIEHEDASEPRP